MVWIADTGFVVGIWDKNPLIQRWALAIWESHPARVLTTEAVLAEACHLVKDPACVAEAVDGGDYELGCWLGDETARIARLMRRYAPRMDLADATVVRLSELCPSAKVLTVDRKDFVVYRREDGSPVPCCFPGD